MVRLKEISSSINEGPTITRQSEIVYQDGRPITVDGIQVGTSRLITRGGFFKVAQLRDEWYDELGDPAFLIAALTKSVPRPDLFTFWQRLPDTVPVYPYYYETEALSAIPLKDFQHWWENQINSDTRKKARRAEKRGLEVRVVPLNDDFVQGVTEIFNETPVRRGRHFWHYGKDFETVKRGLMRDLGASSFIGAYDNGKLVGFVKLIHADGRFSNPGLIVSRLEARKKYVNNALIAKAVQVCCEEGIPYLTYTKWRRGSQADFLARHGFEKIMVPRYWVPLSIKGAFAIKAGLHRGVRSYIPAQILGFFLDARKAFFDRRYNKRDQGV